MYYVSHTPWVNSIASKPYFVYAYAISCYLQLAFVLRDYVAQLNEEFLFRFVIEKIFTYSRAPTSFFIYVWRNTCASLWSPSILMTHHPDNSVFPYLDRVPILHLISIPSSVDGTFACVIALEWNSFSCSLVRIRKHA